ncbi:MAG: hypothetical protein UT24_C0016G0047 [Candidatus Woesebacteria bacterium GW2011_GWB1_39_12]|uniref:Uncharacterized protein n=1 Tax=Candidatus Woesebacteria bacterium GW2011_GWB1_39_12 TaxID=1618574 RepID=A0A0G0MAF7_9BACT|nr:MAG: hypothetical protein UT24_C0016G0047 [Candidatus Woesebacteria bacterium GW2011_GWB1_39_12]
MNIKFDLDYDGIPFIDLEADDDDVETKMLRKFIEEAKKNGIVLKGCDAEKDCDKHATIELKIS